MFGLVLAFVHWGYVYHFHCVIIEHIPEHLVRWHFVSHVDYYLTLGHTPVLGFVVSLLQTFSLLILSLDLSELSYWGIPPSLSSLTFCRLSHCLIYFLIFVSRYTEAYPFSAFLLGHTPSLWVSRVSCWFHGCQTHLSIFMSYRLGHPLTIILFRTSPYCHLI